ncbi:MAG: nitrate/nitrite transporter [Promethearchaeota archaeon]
MEKLRFRWVVLSLAWLSWLVVGTAVLSIGAMLTILIPQFGLTGVQAGTLMAVSWIPGIIFAIPIGVLIDKYGGRKLGTLGMFILAVGLILFAYSETFELLVVARFIIGIAIFIGTTPPQAWMTKWFSDDEIGFAQGFLTSGYASSGIVGIFAMGWILQTIGIYMTVMILGILSLVLMNVFLLARRDVPTALTETTSNNNSVFLSKVVSQASRNVELWLITIAWLSIVGISTAYATFAPITFIALLNLDIVTAAATAGIVQIVAVPSLIIGGRLTDKWKDSGRRIMIWIPTLICVPAFYMIGISTAFVSVLVGVMLIGIFNWVSSAAVYAAGAESVDSEAMVGSALGFLAFGAALGSLILPLLMGFVFDATGSWLLVWAVPAVVAFIGAVVAFFSKK